MRTMKQGSWKNWTVSAVLAGGLVFAGSAQAGDRHSRHDGDRHLRKGHAARHEVGRDRSRVRQARRENRRLDERGALIDLQLDGLALLASASGDYELASVLDRAGDHIERRLDRKGDRRLRQARRHVRAHRHAVKHHARKGHRGEKRYAKHKHRKQGHRGDRIDRKRDHADWLGDRANEAKRDRRNRKSERWDD